MSDVKSLVPPQSLEAEQSVLGAVLLDNSAFDRVSDVLAAEAFYAPEHAALWRTMAQLIAAGQPVDVVTVLEAGGHDLVYLTRLVQAVPSSANVVRWAGIVRERAVERALIAEATAVIERAPAPGVTAEQKVDEAQARFAKLGERRARRDPVTMVDAAVSFLDHLQLLAEGKERVISTGLRSFDRQTAGGIRPGELWVLGARPKMGKTALALAMARSMSVRHGTLFCSQEMPVLQLTMRHVASVGGVNLADLRSPAKMSDEHWGRVSDGVDQVRSLHMAMDDQGALRLLDVRRKLMKVKRANGLDVVFVDYLQLMAGDGENRNQELDRISNGLKAMALEFEVGVVLLSQLSRKADERSGPPVMADLRDSGAIEAAADLIGMLHRDAVRNPSADNKHYAQLEIVAQRNGPAGTVHLWFDGELQRFDDWPDGVPLPRRGAAKRGGFNGGLE